MFGSKLRRTARFSGPFPFVLPRVCRELLSASGSGNRSKLLQSDDIQSVFLFLRRTGNKKGASEKGSFVRIFPFQYIPFFHNGTSRYFHTVDHHRDCRPEIGKIPLPRIDFHRHLE